MKQEKIYELMSIYDNRKSFYKKAHVKETIDLNNNIMTKELISYQTIVAKITIDFLAKFTIYEYYGKYSMTTTRHQREFFAQNNLTWKEIDDLFKKGKLLKKEGETKCL